MGYPSKLYLWPLGAHFCTRAWGGLGVCFSRKVVCLGLRLWRWESPPLPRGRFQPRSEARSSYGYPRGLPVFEPAPSRCLSLCFIRVKNVNPDRNFRSNFSWIRTKFSGIRTKFYGIRNKFSRIRTKLSGIWTKFYGIRNKFSRIRTKFSGIQAKFYGIRTKFSGIRSKLSGIRTKFSGIRTKFFAASSSFFLQNFPIYEISD